VHQLALTRAATVLVTARSGEVAPDAVVALWKDGLAERIELVVLGDASIEVLLVKVLGRLWRARIEQSGTAGARSARTSTRSG
jgi:hypothetical protein